MTRGCHCEAARWMTPRTVRTRLARHVWAVHAEDDLEGDSRAVPHDRASGAAEPRAPLQRGVPHSISPHAGSTRIRPRLS